MAKVYNSESKAWPSLSVHTYHLGEKGCCEPRGSDSVGPGVGLKSLHC